MKFLSPEVALYLYKSTIRPYMEYCCHVWDGAPSCYQELLDKLQKWICKTVGPSLSTSFELLAHSQNVASLSLNWLNWFHFLILEGDLFVILMIDCMTSVTIPRWYKDVSMTTASFLPQLGFGILCLQNAFLRPMIQMALSIELTDNY